MAKVYAGKWMGWDGLEPVPKILKIDWKKRVMRISWKLLQTQTNQHRALHLLAAASGSCQALLLTNVLVVFTCQTRDPRAKTIKLRKRFFFAVITVNGFSLLKLFFYK